VLPSFLNKSGLKLWMLVWITATLAAIAVSAQTAASQKDAALAAYRQGLADVQSGDAAGAQASFERSIT